GGLAPLVRIERHVASIAVGRDRDAELRAPHPDHTGVAPRSDHRTRLDGRVVLLVHPALGGDGGMIEELEERLARSREWGAGSGTLGAQPNDGFVLTRLRRVHRTVVDQPPSWDLHD